jgi:hypothetical protein
MSFFKKMFASLKFFLFSKKPENSETSFPAIDPEAIKAELKIVEQARAQGAVGVPSVRDTMLTETEHQIQGTVGKMRAATLKTGEQWLKQIQQRLDTVDLTQETNRTVQLGDEFVRKADSILSGADARLKEEMREAKAKKEILDSFRSANRLPETPAKLSSTGDHIRQVAFLVIFGAIESVINAVFFASGMAGGLLAGVLLAGLLALVNILGCFFAGFLFTNKNHVSGFRRMLGYLCGLIGLFWTLSMGLFVAYCRYVMPMIDEETNDQLQLIGQSIKGLVLPFSNFESVGLFLVTVACGVFAQYHGYAWLDRYPGYTKIYGSYVKTYRRMMGVINSLRKALETEKTITLEQIDVNVKQAQEAIKRFKRNMGEKSVARKKVTEHLVLADNTIHALTQCYRYENQMVRPVDNPRPDYFSQPVVLNHQEFPDFGTERDQERLTAQENLLSEMVAILEPTRAKVQSSFNRTFDQLKPLETQT